MCVCVCVCVCACARACGNFHCFVAVERLLDVKKQKLLHVFSEPSLEVSQSSTTSTVPNEEESLVNGVSEEQTSFEATTWNIGDKCRAPLEQVCACVRACVRVCVCVYMYVYTCDMQTHYC